MKYDFILLLPRHSAVPLIVKRRSPDVLHIDGPTLQEDERVLV